MEQTHSLEFVACLDFHNKTTNMKFDICEFIVFLFLSKKNLEDKYRYPQVNQIR
jgi:hypothetical protein